jgi:hypothetical protein
MLFIQSFSETKLIVKDNNLKATEKVDFILKHITKKELCNLFLYILKLKVVDARFEYMM